MYQPYIYRDHYFGMTIHSIKYITRLLPMRRAYGFSYMKIYSELKIEKRTRNMYIL